MADAATERRVAELLREERLTEAAGLLADRGEQARAAALYERACDFSRAAEAMLAAGDAPRALELAMRGGDAGALLERILDLLASDAARAERAARELRGRDGARAAAGLFSRLGRHAEAAAAFERALDDKAAAEAFRRAGDALGAARALDRAVARDATDEEAKLRLGALLVEAGRNEAAARTLQRISRDAPERGRALTLLARALDALGLEAARDEAVRELGALPALPLPLPLPHPVAPEGSHVSATGAAPREPGPVLFGRWSVVREVAVTPTARLFEALDRVTGERVAVKRLAAGAAFGAGRDALARFEREARALAELRHPNVVPLRAYVAEGPALVLAWMPGGSLAERMARDPLVPARSAEIACSLLDALGAAHRLGIIHRDVKPSNILFDDAGVTHLADFGAAHLADSAATATAEVIGTLAYMSPEQRAGRPATLASDLWSVGAILAELLTGRPPSAAPLPPLASVHPGLGAEHDALLARLCAFDPAARPSDAFEAARLLRTITWPTDPRPRPRPLEAPLTPSPYGERDHRLVQVGPSRARDIWLERDVLLVPIDARSLTRASAFARAGHPSLASVLRVDREAATIWIEPARGPSLAEIRSPLPTAAAALVSEALDALHAAGGVHGAIDPSHVHLDEGGPTLAFPIDAPEGATAEADRAALARLPR